MLDIRATSYVSPVSEVTFESIPLTVHIVNVADETGLVTGKFRVYNDTTGLMIHSSDIAPLSLAGHQSIDVTALTDFDPPAPLDDTYFVIFDGHASNALVPDGTNFTLGAFYFNVKPTGMGPAPAAHHATHEDGGSDEIDCTGLVGAGGGSVYSLLIEQEFLPWEFYPNYLYLHSPWRVNDIGSNADLVSIAGLANHPGIACIVSGTSAGSGFYFITSNLAFLLAGTEATDFIFALQYVAGTTIRMGFHDSNSAAAPTDGCYLEIAQVLGVDGVILGKTRNNSAESTTATKFTLIPGDWYRGRVSLNATATLVTFTLFNAAGTVVWTDTLNTNIPTARETGHAIVATNSDTSAHDLIYLDYMNIRITRTLTR